MGVLSIFEKIFGKKSERDIKALMPIVEEINKIYEQLSNLSNDELRGKTRNLRQRVKEYVKDIEERIEFLKNKAEENRENIEEVEKIYDEIDELEKKLDEKIEEILNDILPEAFAIVKETARRFKENDILVATATDFDRELAAKHKHVKVEGDKVYFYNRWMAGGSEIVWDMVHFDVQLMGGIVLHQGKIAEMATGEGKTLVATLPVFLNALAGKGVHIVTVNDYLAKRDSEWMGPIYEFHGLSVDCIDKYPPHSEGRKKAYQADITYGTNNEFGFDYLRDNMVQSPEELVQRKLHYAIVDEVDSVLIDDARTPLIISGPVPKGEFHQFEEFRPRVEKLVDAQKKLVAETLAEAKRLIAEGKTDEGGLKLLRAYKGLPKNKALIKYLSEPGIKTLLLKTENFYMQDNQRNMHLVTDELYFVIDEKLNSVELTDKGIELITSSTEDPNLFVLPDIGAQLAELENSGLPHHEILEKKEQLLQEYAIKADRLHTIQQLLKAYTLFERDIEYVVIDNKVKIVDEQTGRIMEGRRYSEGLHQAIEAKERVKVEAATQTWATITLQNYFRMYHKLAGMTGTAETEAAEFWDIYKLEVVVIPTNKPVIREDREDLVYKTKREKYNAIIDEVVRLVKQGRPVLVGTTSVETSELLSRMLKLRGIKHNVLNAKHHQREAEIVAEAGKPSTVTIATNMAGRGTDIKLTPETRAAGGLAIIGSERHEARRIDRQLRGRAGRQGDPGTSQFFVSLEDDLMRLFGSERIASIMDRLGIKEGEVIQHPWITKSIERAQKKVEENNFGIRKRLLEYDDVMNSQREVIYKRRRHALFGDRLQLDISNMMYDVAESIINEFYGDYTYDDFKFEIFKTFSFEPDITHQEFLKLSKDELVNRLYNQMRNIYQKRRENIAKQAYPVIKEVFEKQGKLYENIVVPITDGIRTFSILTNLEKAYLSQGEELVRSYEKAITLYIIDEQWKDHLRELDDLKQAVYNAVFEQRDPLLVYKLESFELFKNMLGRINKEVISILLRGKIPIQDSSQVQRGESHRKTDMSQLRASKSEFGSSLRSSQSQSPDVDTVPQKVQTVRVEKKIGRNDPCPCGSGKKYKHCHGRPGMN